jgi:hypothetical protein
MCCDWKGRKFGAGGEWEEITNEGNGHEKFNFDLEEGKDMKEEENEKLFSSSVEIGVIGVNLG